MGHALQDFGILPVVAGTLARAYGGFSYTGERHDVKLGPLQFTVKAQQRVNIPVRAGFASVTARILLLGGRKN
jgi:hypothetical protein